MNSFIKCQNICLSVRKCNFNMLNNGLETGFIFDSNIWQITLKEISDWGYIGSTWYYRLAWKTCGNHTVVLYWHVFSWIEQLWFGWQSASCLKYIQMYWPHSDILKGKHHVLRRLLWLLIGFKLLTTDTKISHSNSRVLGRLLTRGAAC